MYKLDNDTFDAEVKALLADAQEEVPAGVWEAVSASVAKPAPAKQATASGWAWPSFALAVAAATAVILSILPKAEIAAPEFVESSLIAEISVPELITVPELVEGTMVTLPELVEGTFASTNYVASTSSANVVESSADAVESSADVVESSADVVSLPEPVEGSSVASTSSADAVSVPEPVEGPGVSVDPFEQMIREDEAKAAKKAARKVLIGAGGNLASNGNNSFPGSTHFATSGVAGTPSETTIREQSISTYGVPLSFGLGVTYPVSDKFAVGTGLTYSLLTRSFSGEYIEVENGVAKPAISADVFNRMQYIGIPVNVYYSVVNTKSFDIYCFVGGEVEKGLSNKFVVDGTEQIRMNKSVPGVQLSAAAGLGVQFSLTDNLGLYIDPSVRYYFDCDQPKSIRTAKPYMMTLEAGLRFNLH